MDQLKRNVERRSKGYERVDLSDPDDAISSPGASPPLDSMSIELPNDASVETSGGAPQHRYRPDIDGLRAVAVAGVILFHYYPDAIPGGFVGVDVFFVISGYLISGIISRSMERGSFTCLK